MINGHNAHKKGGDILSSGVKADLLPANSLAVEISLENNAKDQQFAANKNDGGLSPQVYLLKCMALSGF